MIYSICKQTLVTSPMLAHATKRLPHRVLLGLCVSFALAACSDDDPLNQRSATGTLRIVSGAAVTDTVEAQLAQPIVVEVRDGDNNAVSGAVVRFEPQLSADSVRSTLPSLSACSTAATLCNITTNTLVLKTDETGTARALIRLGRVAGRAVIRIVVSEFGRADSAVYTVTPGALSKVRSTLAEAAIALNGTATLRARAFDRLDNLRPDATAATVGSGSAITFDATSGLATAREFGMQTVYFRSNSLIDSTIASVVPAGRLVVVSSAGTMRLINTDGSGVRQLLTGIQSDLGILPHFDATRKNITFSQFLYGTAQASVIDTTGTTRRDVDNTAGINSVLASRMLADGTLLVVGQRSPTSGNSVYRANADNSLTLIRDLPDARSIGGSVDISPDGLRVAYVAPASTGNSLRVITLSTGASVVLDPSAALPRWSNDGNRIAFIKAGRLTIFNSDGSNRVTVGNATFSSALAWSPDGAYILSRSTTAPAGSALRLVRLSDAADVLLRFRNAAGTLEDYVETDWR